MNITEAMDYIHAVSWKGCIPGLSRTQELLSRIGNPEKGLCFVHIAGTNGKGSTAAMLASVLQQAGYRTGLYTSPYITSFNERMQVNGAPITDDMLCSVTAFVKPHAETMTDLPTEFELITCIAMEYFSREQCDIVVLEVGMGGEFDATNVIGVPECAVICRIGLDHTEFLGNTIAEIAKTKAGILKPGGCCVTYPAEPEVEAVYREITAARGLSHRSPDFSALHLRSRALDGQYFDCAPFRNLFIPLLGAHQLENAAVVLCVLQQLQEKGWQITEQHIRAGLRAVRWPGRFEVLRRTPLFVVDGGHNPQCAGAVAQNIRDYLADVPLTILTGVLADKDYQEMFTPLLPYCQRFITVTPPNPRALPAKDLAQYLQSCGKEAVAADSVTAGVALAQSICGTQGAVLAFGSLYMVGEIRQAVLNGE